MRGNTSEEQEKRNREHQEAIEYSNKIAKLIGAIPTPNYAVTIRATYIEETLKAYEESEGLELNPDFQRGHVWTRDQQIAFCESWIRCTLGDAGKTITFNSPMSAVHNKRSDADLKGMVCIDGLQRLTAVRQFMKKEFKVFSHIDGGVYWDFFDNTRFSRYSPTNGLIFQLFDMQYKKDILDYYLAFNNGGTPHSEQEIQRVLNMRQELK